MSLDSRIKIHPSICWKHIPNSTMSGRDPKLFSQLQSILELIRDIMVTKKGTFNCFSIVIGARYHSGIARKTERKANFGLDHVSFGHDYETAFLMLEASYALGLQQDTRTWPLQRKCWIMQCSTDGMTGCGGFYDGGYYFKGQDTLLHH